jgi:hypothetical protein
LIGGGTDQNFIDEEEKNDSVQNELDLIRRYATNHPYNITVEITMSGEIVRLSSRNHGVECSHRQKHAFVKLDSNAKNNFADKDFVLYIKDNRYNETSAISTLNEHNEQCLVVCMNPDLRPPKIREGLVKYFKSKGLDQT